MNSLKALMLVFVMASTFGIAACEEGPMEEAGEKIDSTVNDVANSAEDACEEAKDGMNMEDSDC